MVTKHSMKKKNKTEPIFWEKSEKNVTKKVVEKEKAVRV